MNDVNYTLRQMNPVAFTEINFGSDLWDIEQLILNSVKSYQRTAVKSCHGSGKSFTAARVVIWFLNSFVNSKVITTAPTARQVEEILWSEIRSARAKSNIPLRGKYMTKKAVLGPDWFAMGFSTDEADKFQGYHGEHILMVVDEASGVDEAIFNAIEGSMSTGNAKLLLIGNPTQLGGTFYNAFHKSASNYNCIHISAFDTPNFRNIDEDGNPIWQITLEDIRNGTWERKIIGPMPRPYLITPQWVAEKYIDWGEGSPMWDSRIMGNFPQQGEDTLIPLAAIEKAIYTNLEPENNDPESIGVDVAAQGSDKTVFVYRKGPKIAEIEIHTNDLPMATVENIRIFAEKYPYAKIRIDASGMGLGVYDRLRQVMPDREIEGIIVGQSPLTDKKSERYLNLRAEMSWGLRSRFIEGAIDIPKKLPANVLDDLIAQCSSIKWEVTTQGKIKIESKDDIKGRGLPSPDIFDAIMLAFGMTKQDRANIGSIDPNTGVIHKMGEGVKQDERPPIDSLWEIT